MAPSAEESPWKILGINDETSATAGDVRRAYAKLIREHRPDVDPVGFQRIHQAYLTAQALLSRNEISIEVGAPSLTEEALVDLSPAPEALPSRRMVSAEFSAAEEKLRKACLAGNEKETQAALEQFRPVMKADPNAKYSWGLLLAEVFQDQIPKLASMLPPAAVMRLVESDQPGLADSIAASWHLNAQYDRLVDLAGCMMKSASALTQIEQSLCCAKLAVSLAFRRHSVGEQLANSVFIQLAPGPQRDYVMHQIEQRLMLGKIFGILSPVQTQFWEKRLCGGEDPSLHNWDSHESKMALDHIGYSAKPDWPGFNILHQILPELSWQRLEQLVNRRIQTKANQTAVRAQSRRPRSRHDAPTWVIVWSIILLLRLVFYVLAK